jgi:hypothetical protein
MAQAATAQRTAERAARDRLAGPLISAVGELGVAVAQRETAAAGVSEAEERAREHVRRVQAEAQEMVAAARAQVAAADDAYRAAHQAATDAGWSAAALVDMGYPEPRSTGARATRRKRTAAPRAASVRELVPLDSPRVRRGLRPTAMWTRPRRRRRVDPRARDCCRRTTARAAGGCRDSLSRGAAGYSPAPRRCGHGRRHGRRPRPERPASYVLPGVTAADSPGWLEPVRLRAETACDMVLPPSR